MSDSLSSDESRKLPNFVTFPVIRATLPSSMSKIFATIITMPAQKNSPNPNRTQQPMFIVTPTVVSMFGWTPSEARPRTIALMIIMAPRPILSPNIITGREWRWAGHQPAPRALFFLVDRRKPVYLKRAPAGWRFDLYLVALFAAHQCLADRRNGRDHSVVGVTLFGSHQLVSDLFVFFEVEQHNARTVSDAVGGDLRKVDRIHLRKPLPDLPYAGLYDRLPFHRSYVLGVLTQVAEFAGMLNFFRKLEMQFFFKRVQFFP